MILSQDNAGSRCEASTSDARALERTRTSSRAGAFSAYLALLAFWLPLASSAACVDYTLTEAELTAILDQSLDELRPLVLERSVAVDAANAACYLQMKVRIGIDLFGRRQSCQAQACSVGIVDERKLGIKTFSISGCDLAFNLSGVSRVIRTVYADVSDRIRSHCGIDAFRISNISPQGTPGSGSVRLTLEELR